jgi:hypothetical protein
MKMKRPRPEAGGVAMDTAFPPQCIPATTAIPSPGEPPPVDPLIVLYKLAAVLNRLAAALDRPRPAVSPVVTRKGFARILGVSLAVFDRLRSAGRLPRPDLVIARSPRWRAATIRRFLEKGGRP